MSKVLIFGTASFAEVVYFYLTHDSEHEVIAFTANKDRITTSEMLGLPIIPFEDLEAFYPPESFMMYIAVGYTKRNQTRASIYEQAKQKGYQLVSYISSKCTHWGDIQMGDNCFIFENNTIQPFVTIGSDTILWSGNHIGHHSKIGNHCFISSHVVVSGHVSIGDFCFLGVNSTLRDNISIGNSCIIGAGALIMNSTQDLEVYAGTATQPRPIKSSSLKF